MKLYQPKQAGFSLLETMLIVGVAAAVTLVALATGQKVYQTAKAQETQQMVVQLGDAISARFAIMPNLTGIETMAAQLMPGVGVRSAVEANTPADQIQTPFGVATLRALTINFPNDSWAITFNAVPASECVNLMTRLGPQMTSVSINGVLQQGFAEDVAAANCPDADAQMEFISRPVLRQVANTASTGTQLGYVPTGMTAAQLALAPIATPLIPLTGQEGSGGGNQSSGGTGPGLGSPNTSTPYTGTWAGPVGAGTGYGQPQPPFEPPPCDGCYLP